MKLTEFFKNQLEEESQITRKMLKLVPEQQYEWQPHAKSMTLIRLAKHVAELPGWITMILSANELDFAKGGYNPGPINNNADLMAYFEGNLTESRTQLAEATEDDLGLNWKMRNGDEIYIDTTKAEVLRMTFSQMIHHRAQLGVYLRLLNIPIPGSYGPSADEMEFATVK